MKKKKNHLPKAGVRVWGGMVGDRWWVGGGGTRSQLGGHGGC